MKLDALFARHERVGLDSNVLIYALEGGSRVSIVARAVLDRMAGPAASGVIALIGVAEVLVGPAQTDDAALVERYMDELLSLDGVEVVALNRSITVESAMIRGRRRHSLADAMHLATARSAGASAFLTNDRAIRPTPGLDVIYLADLAA